MVETATKFDLKEIRTDCDDMGVGSLCAAIAARVI